MINIFICIPKVFENKIFITNTTEIRLAVLRRYNPYQGLKELDVLIEDDAPISQYFNVVEVPDVITQGRSSFLIGGSPLLKDNVELKFEIINDESGKVIYTEPVAN